jgi:uncharacterized protein YbdZ (MbtH family)
MNFYTIRNAASAYGSLWPNSADGVQDSSLPINKTHEFSLWAEAVPKLSFGLKNYLII